MCELRPPPCCAAVWHYVALCIAATAAMYCRPGPQTDCICTQCALTWPLTRRPDSRATAALGACRPAPRCGAAPGGACVSGTGVRHCPATCRTSSDTGPRLATADHGVPSPDAAAATAAGRGPPAAGCHRCGEVAAAGLQRSTASRSLARRSRCVTCSSRPRVSERLCCCRSDSSSSCCPPELHCTRKSERCAVAPLVHLPMRRHVRVRSGTVRNAGCTGHTGN